jgi:hypothetical protein
LIDRKPPCHSTFDPRTESRDAGRSRALKALVRSYAGMTRIRFKGSAIAISAPSGAPLG